MCLYCACTIQTSYVQVKSQRKNSDWAIIYNPKNVFSAHQWVARVMCTPCRVPIYYVPQSNLVTQIFLTTIVLQPSNAYQNNKPLCNKISLKVKSMKWKHYCNIMFPERYGLEKCSNVMWNLCKPVWCSHTVWYIE